MSTITDILDAFVTRSATIAGVNTPVKRPRIFNASETPGIAVYRGPTEAVDNDPGGPVLLDLPITVDYYRAQSGEEDPSERAETMIGELLAAIESGDEYLDSTLCEPLYVSSDNVQLPEDAGGVIRATVVCVCRYIRQYGGGQP